MMNKIINKIEKFLIKLLEKCFETAYHIWVYFKNEILYKTKFCLYVVARRQDLIEIIEILIFRNWKRSYKIISILLFIRYIFHERRIVKYYSTLIASVLCILIYFNIVSYVFFAWFFLFNGVLLLIIEFLTIKMRNFFIKYPDYYHYHSFIFVKRVESSPNIFLSYFWNNVNNELWYLEKGEKKISALTKIGIEMLLFSYTFASAFVFFYFI